MVIPFLLYYFYAYVQLVDKLGIQSAGVLRATDLRTAEAQPEKRPPMTLTTGRLSLNGEMSLPASIATFSRSKKNTIKHEHQFSSRGRKYHRHERAPINEKKKREKGVLLLAMCYRTVLLRNKESYRYTIVLCIVA